MIELTGIDVVERDGVLSVAATIAPLAIGARGSRSCVADGERASAGDQESRKQVSAKSLPRSLALTYYDASRDYQAGQARAVIAGGGRSEWRADSPIVLSAAAAKEIANTAMARRWAGRDRMTLRLDPGFADIIPGTAVEIADVVGRWLVDAVTIERLVVEVEVRREPSGGSALPADGRRPVSEIDVAVGVTDIALFDAPDLGFSASGELGLRLAVSTVGGFRAVPVAVSVNGLPLTSLSMARRAVLGRTDSVPANAPAELVDLANSVEVVLTASNQLLLNTDDDALAMGANAMLVGAELIQFGRATEIAPGRYRLSRLLRGRRGTEWAMASHVVGERIVLIDRATLIAIALDGGVLGGSVKAVAHGIADDPLAPPTATITAQGEAMRPLAPAHIRAAPIGGGALFVSWAPRTIAGLAWIDGAGDPDLAGRRFDVTVIASGGEAIGAATLTIDAASTAALGQGVATISVSELGGAAVSRPGLVSVII